MALLPSSLRQHNVISRSLVQIRNLCVYYRNFQNIRRLWLENSFRDLSLRLWALAPMYVCFYAPNTVLWSSIWSCLCLCLQKSTLNPDSKSFPSLKCGIYNSQEGKTKHLFLKPNCSLMEEWIKYGIPIREILSTHEKEWNTDAGDNMSELKTCYAKWQQIRIKYCALYGLWT